LLRQQSGSYLLLDSVTNYTSPAAATVPSVLLDVQELVVDPHTADKEAVLAGSFQVICDYSAAVGCAA
jgi:hypothetical protein